MQCLRQAHSGTTWPTTKSSSWAAAFKSLNRHTMSTTLRALGKASLKAQVAKSKQFVGDAPIEVAEAVKVVRTSAGSSSSASLSPAAGTQVDVPATDNSKILAEDMKSGRRGRSAAKSVEPPSDAKPSTRGKRRAAADETPAGSLASDWSIAPSEADPAVNATSSEADDKENGITAAAETKPGKSAKRKLVDAPPSKTRGKASNVLPTVVEDAVPIEEQGKPSKRTVASWSLETVSE